ncbi:MAG TPA: hypothetical protein ENH10_02490 [Bacteroidetes bacterium]|nr:hypothetical protein [Bacteroidota bacterium]HEX04008.1 hypothetical protein [Bacteroidota bacterium]
MRKSIHNRLDALEASLPPPPIAFMLPEEWDVLLAGHDGNETLAKRELGCEPVLVPDEAIRSEANDMFNHPTCPHLRYTEATVWDAIIECNGGYPTVFNTFNFVLCGDRMTYEVLAGKRPELKVLGLGITEDEERELKEREAAGEAGKHHT